MAALANEIDEDRHYRDHVCGTLIGLACGDAVGTTVEFQRRGSFPEVKDMVGGGPFKLEPGQWTDDTSLALCLAQSLIERKGHDPRDQLQRYLGWNEKGKLSSNGSCFDIGNATTSALDKFSDFNCTRNYCGSTHPSTSGNGSLMRLAPAPMLLRLHPELAVAVAGETSRTTHASKATVDACRYFSGLLIGAMNGASKEALLESGGFVPTGLPQDYWSTVDPPLDAEIAEVVLGASHARREPPDEAAQRMLNYPMPRKEREALTEGTISNSGYVVRTLEAALWAFGRSTNFREGCLLVANLGDDADTVAAIYGQLAGAFYGASGIPEEWRAKLALKGLIDSMAEELFDMSNRVDPCLAPLPPTPPPEAPTPHVPSELAKDRVTRFGVKAAGLHEGRVPGVYWGDNGVASRYQELEDGYMVIKSNMKSYDSLDAFDRDVHAMLHEGKPSPSPDIASNSTGASDCDNPQLTSDEVSEADLEGGRGTGGAMITMRRAALTDEFAARAALDRIRMASTIRLRVDVLRHVSAAAAGGK